MVYNDAYNEITDKVGVRFVVLLLEQVTAISHIIQSCSHWVAETSRHYEEDRAKNPTLFDYQSVHFILYSSRDFDIDGVAVAAGTSCEVQVRTLMQHAYSEMSHDTVYKPSALGTPDIHRNLARCMALIETTDQMFKEANVIVNKLHYETTKKIRELSELYCDVVGEKPLNDMQTDVIILGAYHANINDIDIASVKKAVEGKKFISDGIQKHRETRPLYGLSSILFMYYFVPTHKMEAKRKWPLTQDELLPVYTDLGINMD